MCCSPKIGDIWEAREMTQLAKCLPCKHEDLSLISRTHEKKSQMWWHALVISAMGGQGQVDP